MDPHVQGLSTSEVLERRNRGLGNDVLLPTSRSYWSILRENVFTFINNVLFALGIVLVVLGRPSDAVVAVCVILVNVVVSVIQETRAKRVLDKISLLTRPTARVIRDGQEQEVDPKEIVVGDILVACRGDQIVADGPVVGDGQIDVDESLLSGESALIPKREGDHVHAGSFCMAGSALYEAQKVGLETLANQLTAGARAFRRVLTPLQREINLMIRVILLVAIYFEFLLIVYSLLSRTPFVESVRMSVVILGLVPNGLFLSISVAYAMAAVRIADRGALTQQINAIESLSNVDVLCLDKTGTLTTNRIRFHAVRPMEGGEEELRRLLGEYAASTSAGNPTSEAIAAACPGRRQPVVEEVPFSSERKWSALALAGGRQGVYVLGAPEILQPTLGPIADPSAGPGQVLADQVAAWAEQGLRVLLFAFRPDRVSLYDDDGQPRLPADLTPLGLLSLEDELRPEARETLAAFANSGVQLKIVSGDNPHTVAALARQAGLGPGLKAVSGLELEKMDDADFAQTVAEATVFGRISPQQKERLVQTLRDRGHYVSMIGDGVNDVLSLKRAQLGIAMQSGSAATRNVADIVLLNDSFSSLPHAVREGQRIINGMQDILKLFMTRVLYVALMIPSTEILGSFPFVPKHTSLLVLFTVGLPTIALAAWARPAPLPRGSLVQRLLHFVLPAVLTLSVAAVAVFSGFLALTYQATRTANPQADQTPLFQASEATAQTALTVFSILCGILLIVFVEPPTEFWVGGDRLSGDWRPSALAACLVATGAIVVAVPRLREFFELAPLRPLDYAVICGAVLLWATVLRWIWRTGVMDRLLDSGSRPPLRQQPNRVV